MHRIEVLDVNSWQETFFVGDEYVLHFFLGGYSKQHCLGFCIIISILSFSSVADQSGEFGEFVEVDIEQPENQTS